MVHSVHHHNKEHLNTTQHLKYYFPVSADRLIEINHVSI